MARHSFDFKAMQRRALQNAIMQMAGGFMQAGAPTLLPGQGNAALGQSLMSMGRGYQSDMMNISGLRQQQGQYQAQQERQNRIDKATEVHRQWQRDKPPAPRAPVKVMEDGAPVWRSPKEAIGQPAYVKSTTGSAREKKIMQYRQLYPQLTMQQIVDVVDKNRIIQPDSLGNIWSISTTTGDKKLIVDVTAPSSQAANELLKPEEQMQPPIGPESVVTPGKNLVVEDAAYDAIGIEETLGQGYDGIAGFLWGADQSYPETAEARDYIRKIREAIVAANLKNPKALASEMERLLRIAPSADGWFKNPAGNRMKARAMRSFLMQNNYSDEFAIRSERMSPKARQETLDKIAARKDLLRMMGVPEKHELKPGVMGSKQYPFSPQTQKQFDDLQVGDYYIDPDDGLLYEKVPE